jgi:hypothetical protein
MKNTKQSVVFCDIDGCILKVHENGNCSKLITLESELLPGVIDRFNEWDKSGYKIVLTTGRPNSAREVTESQLRSHGLFWHVLLMEMGSNKRFLINDIHPDHKENTAYAINLTRNKGLESVDLEREASMVRQISDTIYNCPECGKELPPKVVCNIHGTFCSDPCIDAATERGYPKHIEDALKIIERCLGTGSVEQWQSALNDINRYIKGTHQNG